MFFFNFFDRDREEEEQRKDACRRPARSSVCSIFSGEETDGRLCVCKCSVRNCKEGIVCLKNLSFFPPRRERYFLRNQKRERKAREIWVGYNTLNFIEAKFNERREILTKKDAKDDDDARWWRSFFSVLSSRVVRPSPTQRVLFFIVEEKGFEYPEYDDDSERSDFVIDDAMLFVVFVFKLEGDE